MPKTTGPTRMASLDGRRKRRTGRAWSIPVWSDADLATLTLAEQLVTLWRVFPDQAPRNARTTIQAWLRRFDELAAAHDETPVNPERVQRIREGLLRHGRAITTSEAGVGRQPARPGLARLGVHIRLSRTLKLARSPTCAVDCPRLPPGPLVDACDPPSGISGLTFPLSARRCPDGGALGVSPMDDEAILRARVHEAIRTGRLPARRPDRTWSGPGVGFTCAVCERPIRRHDREVQLQFEHAGRVPGLVYTFPLHLRCFAAWEFERRMAQG